MDKIDSVLAQKLYHDRLLYFWTKLIGCFPPATPVSVLPGYPVTWTHNLFGHKTPATENNGQRKQSHYFQSNDTTYKKPMAISGQFLASKMLVKLHKKIYDTLIHYVTFLYLKHHLKTSKHSNVHNTLKTYFLNIAV